jgi:alpha-galactosidase
MRIVLILLGSAVLATGQTWTLQSGPVEYRLRQDAGVVRLDYFGPSGGSAWPKADRADLEDAAGFELLSSRQPAADSLTLLYGHHHMPLQLEAVYTARGDTGTFTRRIRVTNSSAEPVSVSHIPELYLQLPPGTYGLTYLYGGWGQERQVATELLGPGTRAFVSDRGRSTSIYSPWFALRNATLGVTYMAQFAWSGNWKMTFERQPASANTTIEQTSLTVSLGTQYDADGPLTLAPHASRVLPEVAFTATAGSLDDAANQLHRYQNRYVIPTVATNNPLLVQFNSWYPFPGNPTTEAMKNYVSLAAKIGAEAFVLDSGWYNKKDWSTELGDYQVNRNAFPNGLEELAKHVRAQGMRFGLWVEIENLGSGSDLIKQHPEWLLSFDGTPVRKGVRSMLNFAKPEVRAWADATVDRLVNDYGLEWIKIDYNTDIGHQFDPGTGAVLADHYVNYYAWLDGVRARHPKLVIENCSSGGLRFDLGILAHTHTTWLSDVVAPKPSLQLGWGCTLEFTPEVCNHWTVGGSEGETATIDSNAAPGWWDFLFRVPMNGQWGISSRIRDWSPALLQRTTENIALYKQIRSVIRGADVYHLTPQPSRNDPKGWMAIQYVTEDRGRSVVMTYRLADGEPERYLRLQGLHPGATYRVSIDGISAGQTARADELAASGLAVKLDADWRAAVVTLERADR